MHAVVLQVVVAPGRFKDVEEGHVPRSLKCAVLRIVIRTNVHGRATTIKTISGTQKE